MQEHDLNRQTPSVNLKPLFLYRSLPKLTLQPCTKAFITTWCYCWVLWSPRDTLPKTPCRRFLSPTQEFKFRFLQLADPKSRQAHFLYGLHHRMFYRRERLFTGFSLGANQLMNHIWLLKQWRLYTTGQRSVGTADNHWENWWIVWALEQSESTCRQRAWVRFPPDEMLGECFLLSAEL